MANKKISQLTSMGTVGIGSEDYLVTSESTGGGNYATVKTTPNQVSNYVLNPVTADQISGAEKNIFFNNASWTTAGLGESFPYLQIDINNGGKLVTGSGISVPSIADNMGDCVVTTDLYAQGFDFTGCYSFYFGDVEATAYNARSYISSKPYTDGQELEVKAYTDLTLSGNDYVRISGQALSLENGDTQTPISGNVIITGGNVEIDPANKLIVNEITITKHPGFSSGTLSIEGASYHLPNKAPDNGGDISWGYSNIQYCVCDDEVDVDYDFNGVVNGQTLTLYVKNPEGTEMTPTFINTDQVPVIWGAEYGNTAPAIAANKTNLYTFVRINTGIFASAVTGYVY